MRRCSKRFVVFSPDHIHDGWKHACAGIIHSTTYAPYHFLRAQAAGWIINHFYSLQPLISPTLKCSTLLLSAKLPGISILQMCVRSSLSKRKKRMPSPPSLDPALILFPPIHVPLEVMSIVKSWRCSNPPFTTYPAPSLPPAPLLFLSSRASHT